METDYGMTGVATTQLKVSAAEALTPRLHRLIDRSAELAALSDQLAFRIAGPTNDAKLSGGCDAPEPSTPPLGYLIDQLSDRIGAALRSLERATGAI